MRWIHLCLLISLFGSQIAVCQVSLKGSVRSLTGESLPFANIYIKHTSIGTVSNEQGAFEMQFSRDHKDDTLIVSYIGYQSAIFPISSFKTKTIEIVLKEDILELTEITIQSGKVLKNADLIVRTAINKMKSTHNPEAHLLKGFYRHTYEQDGAYKQLIEAAITVYENQSGVYKFNVDQFRRSNDFREMYDEERLGSKNGTSATPTELLARDRARKSLTLQYWYRKNFTSKSDNSNELTELGHLDTDFTKEHKFKLDTITTFENEYVYVIKILPSAHSKPYPSMPQRIIIPVGRMYIRVDDFAILKMEYQYILNPKKRKTDDYRIYYAIHGTGLIFKTTALYKEFGDFFYLSYLHTIDYRVTSIEDRKVRGKNGNSVYNLIERSFLVNEVVVDKESVNSRLNEGTWNDQLYQDSYTYDETFWKGFTIMSETENQVKLRKDLEKQKSLETQFKLDR